MDLNQKKIGKKLRKHQHIVRRETGAQCSNEPTEHLALCNIGQVNGLTEHVVLDNFKQYGSIERVLLIPGKSCSFLSYKHAASATAAWCALNGKLNIAQDNKPVFLSYVVQLPQLQDEKIWTELPPGLTVIDNFVTQEEETLLMSLCHFSDDVGNMKHRQVRHFGYEFRYDINNVDKDKPLAQSIPEQCDFLWQRLNKSEALPCGHFIPNQLTVNQYKPGQGIPAHIDTHSAFEDPIISLSLNAPVVMEFKKLNKTVCVLLPRRSLAIISGECRYDWSHAITPKKYDFYMTPDGCNSFKRDTRVSFTFRKVLKGQCNCPYKLNCDSYKIVQMEEKVARRLEKQHVHEVYEDIANHFSTTRHKPWPNVLEFARSFDTGQILVDVGCGNGKYFGYNRHIFEIGIDRSFNLNELCKDRNLETLTSNCLQIPFRDMVADGVMSIAVIHHLATQERRLHAIKEMVRILRVGGRALIYVWAKDQVKNQEKSSYIKQDRKQRTCQDQSSNVTAQEVTVSEGFNLPVHTNRTNFNHSDLLVPWKLKKSEHVAQERTFLRFYHVFEGGELDNLCLKLPNISIIKSYYDQGNYCVILEKFK